MRMFWLEATQNLPNSTRSEYWRYGGARYAKAYAEASSARAGMHAGTFIEPELWRRGQRY